VGEADVLICDNLASDGIIARARTGCEIVDVSKRGGNPDSTKQEAINAVLVAKCLEGKVVVRLKGGCPMVYGRVWPEIEALDAAGVAWHLVPGVSSILAAPAAVGIPLTEKTLSRHFGVVSGHKPDELDWDGLASLDTVVVIMGTRKLETIARLLMGAGRDADTPVAIVQWCYHAEDQRLVKGTLETIVEAAKKADGPLSPAIIVVGAVAAFARGGGGGGGGGAGDGVKANE
jgi:uroporphyrinogen III methyltransferase/synthase